MSKAAFISQYGKMLKFTLVIGCIIMIKGQITNTGKMVFLKIIWDIDIFVDTDIVLVYTMLLESLWNFYIFAYSRWPKTSSEVR